MGIEGIIVDRTTAKTQWISSNPAPREVFDGGEMREETPTEYNSAAELGADLMINDQLTTKEQQIRSFYRDCKAGTATIGQMRTAWVQLIEYLYRKEVAS